MPYRDNHGIYFTGLFQFLKSEKLMHYQRQTLRSGDR